MASLYTSPTSETLLLRSPSLAHNRTPCCREEGRCDPPLKICLETEYPASHLFTMCLLAICHNDRADIVLGDRPRNEDLGLIISRATPQVLWCAPAYPTLRPTYLCVEKGTPAMPAGPQQCSVLCSGITGRKEHGSFPQEARIKAQDHPVVKGHTVIFDLTKIPGIGVFERTADTIEAPIEPLHIRHVEEIAIAFMEFLRR